MEVDQDGLVRTCKVAYRLVRSDLPVEEMRIYFKGMKYKEIRVPVQRLCVILPVEEQENPPFLRKSVDTDTIEEEADELVMEKDSDSVTKLDSEGEKEKDSLVNKIEPVVSSVDVGES